jgi:uncharacterized phage-associated protein
MYVPGNKQQGVRRLTPVGLAGEDEKLGELLLYVAQRLEGDPHGGATKINKVLFFSEFAFMRTHGRPITGAEYQKLDRGPAPRRLLPVREWLIESGAARLETSVHRGYHLARLTPLRDFNRSMFTDDEIAQVDEVIDDLHSYSAIQVSEMSHAETGWRMVEFGETIPYEAAYLIPGLKVTDKMRRHAEELSSRLSK